MRCRRFLRPAASRAGAPALAAARFGVRRRRDRRAAARMAGRPPWRRLALGLALLVLTVTSLLAAASSDMVWLTVFRVLSGLALGAYPALMVAYLSDVLPPGRRGRMILICGAIGFLGAPAVVFLIRWLTPLAAARLRGLALGAGDRRGRVGLAFAGCRNRRAGSPAWGACRGRAGLPAVRAVGPASQRRRRSLSARPTMRGDARKLLVAGRPRHRWRAALLGVMYSSVPGRRSVFRCSAARY